jgi:nucleoid-associated protein
MALTSIIAHNIYRHTPGNNPATQTRSEPLPLNGRLEDLAYELKTQFIRKGGKSYGRFSDQTGEYPFPAWLKDYRHERMGFASFTQKAIQQFQQLLENAESPLDSYVFFVEETIEAGQYLYIFVVEHETGLYLDANLALTDSMYLDTANFNLAAKIDYNDWDASNSATYLTLMRSRSDKDIADAFGQFVGFADKCDLRTDTREFLDAVEQFTRTLDEPTARLTRTKVANYCLEQNKTGKAVAIAELSHNLAEEIKSYTPTEFVGYLEQQKPELKPEFIPHTGQVRSYVRISGRNDSLSMSFASECLGKDVEYDQERDLLMIKNIPASLKKQLLAHLKQAYTKEPG